MLFKLEEELFELNELPKPIELSLELNLLCENEKLRRYSDLEDKLELLTIIPPTNLNKYSNCKDKIIKNNLTYLQKDTIRSNKST